MATIKDIAGITGLSLATISKYINGGKLKPANALAISAAIEELGYEANEQARNLKMNKTMTIGVLLPELTDTFGTSIITAIAGRLQEQGYGCMVCMYAGSPGLQSQLDFMRKKKVDGIILLPQDDSLTCIEGVETPVVLFDRLIAGVNRDAVVVDNAAAAAGATMHLLENGHERIAILCGSGESYTARERLLGYKRALTSYDLPIEDDLIFRSDLTVEHCFDISLGILTSKRQPSAIFATNYYSSQGLLMAAMRLKLQLGEDISAVAFDDMSTLRLASPALTTVAQPIEQIGQTAAQLMLDKLAAPDVPAQVITLNTRLILRESVKNLKG